MKDDTLLSRFLDFSDRFPERKAIVHNGCSISYADLETRSGRLAGLLLENYHVKSEQLIGVHGLRSINSITAMLASMMARGAYVPIPADWPEFRKCEIIADAHTQFVLDACADPIDDLGGIERVSIEEAGMFEQKNKPAFPILKSDQLGYVIYTSGSTGKPKGAMLEYRNVLNMLDGFEKLASHPDKLIGAGLVSIGFDVSVWEIFSVLCFGGTLHIIDHPEMVSDLACYFGKHQINSAYLPPMILDDFLREVTCQGIDLALKRMLVGVEPIAQKTLQNFMDVLPGLQIINGYGPTETAICATFYSFKKAIHPERRTPIGKAVTGNQIYLVNENNEQVAQGEEGEILICGAGVGQGYYADVDLTSIKFIPDPFTHGGNRCFRSGDYVRRLPDGNIEYIGRKDQQFKISGYRVEAGEIEAALMRWEGVQHAVVEVKEDVSNRKKILAYYTTVDCQPVDSGDLRKFLAQQLPSYMQPQALTHLKEFPRTVNGKIDRKQLPEPVNVSELGEISNNQPCTKLETALLAIYSQVFGHSIKNINAGFYALGGNSLQAARIILLIKDQLNYSLTFKDFYEHTAIGNLAEWLLKKKPDEKGAAGDHIPVCPEDAKVPLSYSQERLWFMAQSEPDNPSLHSSFVLRLTGDLDVTCLIDSLKALVFRHEILRTVFKSEDGVPYQEILPGINLPFYQVNLSKNDAPENDLAARITDLNLETFDISAAPPFRMVLFKISPKDYALAVIIHHIIVDGWSAEIFRQDLARFYELNLKGQKIPQESVSIHYADYACWQKSEDYERRIQPQLDYWKKRLEANQQATFFPKDKPRPLSKSSNASTIWLNIEGDLYAQLKDYCKEKNTTKFAMLFSAFCLALQRHVHQDTIQLGSFFANRSLKEMENIIGPFVNGVVLKLDLASDTSFDELVANAGTVVMEAQQNQEVPIENVIDAINARRDRSQRTMFGVVFNFVNIPRTPAAPNGMQINYMEFEAGTVIYDLNVEFSEGDEGLIFDFEYNTDIYYRETIERFVQHFKLILEQALSSPEKNISDYDILTAGELAQIEEWSCFSAPYPRDSPIHRLFEHRAAECAENTAVVYGDREISYKDLNRRANQLAGFLLKEGLNREDLVGICLPRSIDMLVSILAVLKAGGAYLPLDPAYPREHLHTILQDAHPVLVLTNETNRNILPVDRNKMICLEDWEEEILAEAEGNLDIDVKSENLAYCIYTSGSTGRPKGVLIEHRSLANFTSATMRDYGITSDDRMLQFASLNFDTSIEEIFPTLCSGAVLVLRTDTMIDNLARFLQYCREWKLTILDLPTAFWHELVLYLEDSRTMLPETVRLVIIGGERVSPVHLDTWHRLGMHSVRLENTYGLTECTCVVTHCELTALERKQFAYREATIGRAISNVEIYVLDDDFRKVPVGVAGELYVGGVCLAREYLNLPELTAERFIRNPFGQGGTSRLYKTGDQVQWRGDGSLEYLGRSDEQIKVRGFRIEPGEIEAVLLKSPDISDAVVIKRSDPAGTEQLLAYLLLEEETSFQEEELRNFLKSKLPKYMLPAFYMVLDEFPLSPNLKINKQALPDPDWNRIAVRGVAAEPETPSEEKMLAIWENALGRKGIGVEDNFFDIGGHSLLAARMMTEVEVQFGVPIPLVELLEKPTIRQLSEAITNSGWKPSWKSVVSMKASGNQQPLFLIHAIGGDILSYRRLVKRLQDLDRPIYGVRAQGLGGVAEPFDNIPDMAAFYLNEIRETQSSGPYFIGGYSFGGTVAYEIAQQLLASGEKVAFLAMFDTVVLQNLPDELRPGKLLMAYEQICRIWFVIKKWLGLRMSKKLEYFNKAKKVISDFFVARFTKKKFINPNEQKDYERWLRKPPAFQKIEEKNNKALITYIAAPYPGRITLFKARQREWSEMVNPEPLWRKLAGGGLDVYVCDGSHGTILLNPYVESLASELEEALDRTEDRYKKL